MTFLVAMTAVHQRVLAEDVFDRPAQRLAAVDDEQDRLVGIEATVDEIGQQRPGQRGVLGAAFPEPERDLDALRRDAERDDVGALGDFDAVEHHHREAHVVEPAGHQLPQRAAGALDEHVRDRGLAGRRGRLLDLAADGLADPREPPCRDAGEHPVHHRPRQRVTVGEILVAVHRQLVLVVGRAHPGPAHRHAAAAKRHRPVLVTVTLRRPVGVVLALRADDLDHLELDQLVHDAEPNTDAEREQTLPRCPDELAERLLDLRRQRTLGRLQGPDDLRRGYLLHGGCSRPRGLGWRLSRSQRERTRREDRRSKFYDVTDNLTWCAASVSHEPSRKITERCGWRVALAPVEPDRAALSGG